MQIENHSHYRVAVIVSVERNLFKWLGREIRA
jgi:hypothetical protein